MSRWFRNLIRRLASALACTPRHECGLCGDVLTAKTSDGLLPALKQHLRERHDVRKEM